MRAVIAQSDLLTAYGSGIDAIWTGLIEGRTAITATNPFTRAPSAPPLAMVPELAVPPGQSRVRAILDRLLAALPGKFPPSTPIILATTVGEIEAIEQSVLQNNPSLAAKASPTRLLAEIKNQLGLTGPGMILSSACASSSAALCRAAALIERGEAESILVITADAVSEFVHAGFTTLLSLCDGPAKPFDAGHCGLSLGEGAAWALITREDSPSATNNSPVILGWSSTADAIHMTAPDREANGLTRAITQACQMSRISPAQIDLIAAHGTGTLYNDSMEMRAFHRAIDKPTPTFSIKGATGHTLAAAGLMQILVACHGMKLGIAPPTVGLVAPDETAMGWAANSAAPLSGNPIALSTNSGFGGVNTAVILADRLAADVAKMESRPAVHAQVSVPARPGVVGIGWFSSEDCGAIRAGAEAVSRKSPVLSDTKELTDLIGLTPKYFPRMTSDTRAALAAASQVMRLLGWRAMSNVGIVGCDFSGWLAADQTYFRDYIEQGRTLGRANHFIYTLPTSSLSEVAIALGLNGPTLHLHDDQSPAQAMVSNAIKIVQAGEAAGMLCILGDTAHAVCIAVGTGDALPAVDLAGDVLATIRQFRTLLLTVSG